MKKITIEFPQGDKLEGMVDIVSEDFHINYTDTISHHGLQCNFDGDNIKHKLIMSFCKRITESAREIIKLNEVNAAQASVARDDDSSTSADLQKTPTDNFTDGRELPKSYSELEKENKDIREIANNVIEDRNQYREAFEKSQSLLKEKEDQLKESLLLYNNQTQTILKLQAALKEDGWIDVNDRLPEFVLHNKCTSEKVIIQFEEFTTIGSLYKTFGDKKNVWFTMDDTFDEQFYLNVTRWQPLPQPPTTLTTKT